MNYSTRSDPFVLCECSEVEVTCGYAVVAFEHCSDALEALNFFELLEKQPMHVSWADHI